MVEGQLFTVDQVAEKLQVHRDTVYRWLRAGQLKGFQLGGRKAGWRVSEADLAAFLEKQRG